MLAPLISLTSGALTSITQFLNTAIKLISMLPGASIENVRISLPQVIAIFAEPSQQWHILLLDFLPLFDATVLQPQYSF